MAATTSPLSVTLGRLPCPAWCVSDHADDDAVVARHRSARLTEGCLSVFVVDREPLKPLAILTGEPGARVYLDSGRGDYLSLSLEQVHALAQLMTALKQDDAAALLRRATDLLVPDRAEGEGR